MSERAHATSYEGVRSPVDERDRTILLPLVPRRASGAGPNAPAGASTPSSRIPIQMFADAVSAGMYPRVVQLDGAGSGIDADEVHALAHHGLSGAGGSVPHLAAIQRSFGHHDLTGVQAHVGGRAAEASAAMGAHAYASGDQVAFASAPDLHLAAHELAHVVQQRGGVRLAGGVGRDGDEYERHADAVADLVVRGESAEALLDTMAHRGAAGGSALQLFRSTDPMTSLARLNAVLDTMTATEAQVVANQLQAGIDARQPRIHLQFTVGDEPYDLVIAQSAARRALTHATSVEIMSDRAPMCHPAPSAPTAAPTSASSTTLTSGGSSFIPAVSAIVGTMAGPEGHVQELTININIPTPWAAGMLRVVGSLRLRLAHGRVGAASEEGGDPAAATYQLEVQFLGGVGLEEGPVRARLMAGLQVTARGTTPEQAVRMALLAMETQLRGVSADVADALFTREFHDDARASMEEGDSAEASSSIRLDGRAGTPRGAGGRSSVSAAAGFSSHSVTDVHDGEVRDRLYTMFDATGTITVDRGAGLAVTGTVTAHIPVGEGAATAQPSISFRLRGSVPATGAQAMIFDVVGSLLGSVLTQLEHGPERGSDAARRLRRLQDGLREVSVMAEYSITRGAHEGASGLSGRASGRGNIGIELEIGIGHGDPTVTLRLVHQVTAGVDNLDEIPVRLGDITYDEMTEIPLRAPPGLACEVEPHFTPAER